MGMKNSQDTFPEKMYNLMARLEFLGIYLDNLLIISNSMFEDHLHQLQVMLWRLKRAGLKLYAEKSSLFVPKIEYLGYIQTKDGIKSVNKNIQEVLDSQPPSIPKELRSFLSIVQFY